MDSLLNSRMSKDASPTKLENLSPEKYGKGAYAELTYTPSRLADNVLYKEVITMKKVQEESSKVRESGALNSMLKDRLSQLQEEKDGIEQTLTQQIVMYKKLLSQNQAKNEKRLNELQRSFNEEMQRIIFEKEEEVKYSQSEKEVLENRIQELEHELADHKEQLSHGGNNFETLKKAFEKLEIGHRHTCQKLEETEKRWKEDKEKAKADYQELSRKLYNTQVENKSNAQKLELEREKQKQNLLRLHRTELEKQESKRQQEATLKNQELKDLTATFEAEASRLNDIIAAKERRIDGLNGDVAQEKEKLLNVTRNSTEEITNLVHEKSRLKEEIEVLNVELESARLKYKDLQGYSDRQLATLQGCVNKLKEELELTQVNYIREKDKGAFVVEDLNKEMTALRVQNDRLAVLGTDNSALYRQIRGLKDLLLESSLEMQKCKEEFIRIGQEKDMLAARVRELGFENESLHRMKVEKDEEARGWRQSYYLSRR